MKPSTGAFRLQDSRLVLYDLMLALSWSLYLTVPLCNLEHRTLASAITRVNWELAVLCPLPPGRERPKLTNRVLLFYKVEDPYKGDHITGIHYFKNLSSSLQILHFCFLSLLEVHWWLISERHPPLPWCSWPHTTILVSLNHPPTPPSPPFKNGHSTNSKRSSLSAALPHSSSDANLVCR